MPQLKPVRLLLADYTKTFGGAPEHAVSLTKYLTLMNGAEVTFLSPQEGLRRRIEDCGGRFAYLELLDSRLTKPESSTPLSKGYHLFREWCREEIPTARKILRIARELKTEIIQLNNLPSFQRSAVIAAKLHSIPCIATHQGFENQSRSLRWMLPQIRVHVAISRAIERHILALGVDAGRIRLIHDAIDTARFHPGVSPVDFEALFGIPRGTPTFGIVGRVIPWKGHEVFLDVAAQVFRSVPNAQGIIIGDVSDGEASYLELLKQKAADLGIAKQIVFAGRREDVPGFMKALSVVVHLSREPEPLGLVVAEALAVGTPVVAMNEGGVPDMLQDGETGYLCPPNPLGPTVSAIESLLRDETKRRSFGERGARFIPAHFSGEECARKYADLYQELLSAEDASIGERQFAVS